MPLTPGTRYWLRVRAHNAAGYGPATGLRRPTSHGPLPGPSRTWPRPPGWARSSFTWTAPVAGTPVGSTAVASYKVESSADGVTWTSHPETTATSTVVSGLTGGVAYQFRVSARSVIDNVGYGPATVIAPDAPSGAPGAPQNVTLGWEEAVGKFRLAWQPPSSDGGRDLTHYVYEVAWTGPNAGSDEVGADTTHADLATVPLDHEIQVRACNGAAVADCGPWSDPLGPVTGPVVDLQAGQSMAGTARTVQVDWAEPANGPATSYDVLRSDDGGATFDPMATILSPRDLVRRHDHARVDACTSTRWSPAGAAPASPRTTSITTGPDQTLSISPTTIDVTEGSSTGAQVVLGVVTSVPTDVTVVVSNPALATVASATVQVAAGESTANVTVTGEQDVDLVDGSTTLTATLGVLQGTATVNVDDNDTQAILAPAVVAVADGATESVDVKLAHQPTEPVTVTVGITQNGQKIEVDATQLTFTPANWNAPQTLHITRNSSGAATVDLTATGSAPASITVTEP